MGNFAESKQIAMIIANPIYDVVFKRLMENEKVAKFFIGTLLEETIVKVEVQPQEFTYTNELAGLAVFRLDFIATIQTETGEYKKLLIEIQKAKNFIDLMRFRSYLAAQYKKEDKVEEEKVILPITTIYILGFKLPELESACVKVARNYIDLLTKTVIDTKSDFIEKLTHDSYVVQVDKINDRFQTRLEKLLSIFEQRNFIDEKEITKNYLHTPDIEELQTMTSILHYVGTDPQERKQIEVEQEAWRTVNAMFEVKEKKYLKKMEEQEQALREQEQAMKEQEQALREQEQAMKEQEKAMKEQEQALQEKDKLIEALLKKLNEQKE